jgi:hypothetical protein
MSQEMNDDELDAFLKATGIASDELRAETSSTPLGNWELEKVLSEIMGDNPNNRPHSTSINSSFLTGERGTHGLGEKEKKRRKLSLVPLWLSISFLGAFFLGTIFGLYWAKTTTTPSTTNPYEKLESQLSLVQHDLEKIRDIVLSLTPMTTTPEEIIEPLPSPLELAPVR